MTEQEADDEARQRNRQLGAAGIEYEYWVAVPSDADRWTVELRKQRRSWFDRVSDAFLRQPDS